MLYADVISFFVTKKCQEIQKLMKIVNIDRENLHTFWTTGGISMKFWEKMRLMIILKVTKNQGFNLSLRDILLEKPQWGGWGEGGESVWPPPAV